VPEVPVEPPPSRWELPSPAALDPGADIAGVGADLEPGTLLAAYRAGLFPMRLAARTPIGRGPLAWWSPDPRGIIPIHGLTISRSLRRSRRRFEIRIDTAFDDVVRGCADPRRPHGWIDSKFIEAYNALHDLGWAHSVETWLVDDAHEALVGGLYGVAIGGLFAAESKFHRVTDASKVALVALVELMDEGGGTLLDVQWTTPHLESLGAVDVPRERFLALVADAVGRPSMSTFPDHGGR
jgi:leucyl/phenylalanyl-tRNA--protein transferase